MRGLLVHSSILFTCKPGNVIGLSSVNPVGRTENDSHNRYNFLVHTTENLFYIQLDRLFSYS